MSNQIQNKPTAAFILSLLGGIIGLLVGLALLALGALTYSFAIAGTQDTTAGGRRARLDAGNAWKKRFGRW